MSTEAASDAQIKRLIQRLDSLNIQEREETREQIIRFGSDAVIPLVKAVNEKQIKKYWEAVITLAQLVDSRVGPILVDWLNNSDDPFLKEPAATALASFGTQYLDVLINALPRADFMVTLRIASILGTLGDRRAVAPLITILQETDSSTLRLTIIQSLGLIGDPTADDVISTFLNDSDHHVRKRARIALESLQSTSTFES